MDISVSARNNLIDGIKYDVSKKRFELKKNIVFQSLNTPNTDSEYIVLNPNETFNGKGHTITIIGTNSLLSVTQGVFGISTSVTTFAQAPVVEHLRVKGIVKGSDNYGGGGIIRANSQFFTVKHCKHYGTVGDEQIRDESYASGGICGANCANYQNSLSGRCLIYKCAHYGTISDWSGGITGPSIAQGQNSRADIIKCRSHGNISSIGGGICSTNAGKLGGTCNISKCHSVGHIGTNAGGICGMKAGTGGNCIISQCYAIGITDNNNNAYNYPEIGSGGICGAAAGNNEVVNSVNVPGTCTVDQCFFIGSISQYSGGIMGVDCANSPGSKVTVTNCYTICDISNSSGGIIGAYACGTYSSSPSLVVDTCFSVGRILDKSGGIIGSNAGSGDSSNLVIRNCYSTGDIDTFSGGICGSDPGTISISNCYSKGRIGLGASGIVQNGGSTVVLNNVYAQGKINSQSYGISSTYNTLTKTNVYSRNQGNLLSSLKKNIDVLPSNIWEATHKYPILRAFSHPIWDVCKDVKHTRLSHRKQSTFAKMYTELNMEMWEYERVEN